MRAKALEGGGLGDAVPHPRAYGTFPRVLGKYVREDKVLTLEQAVRKMTGMPAARLGAIIIVGLIRGVVKPGVDHQTAMVWLIEGLRDCCAAAAAQGARLALEPINRYETTLINTAEVNPADPVASGTGAALWSRLKSILSGPGRKQLLLVGASNGGRSSFMQSAL